MGLHRGAKEETFASKGTSMKFGYAIVYVSSVPEALAFYKEAFGFQTRFLHESNEYGELEAVARLS